MKKATVKTKKVTIDDLAVMVAKGFDGMRDEMSGRFEEVRKRFDKVEDRLGKVEENLGSLTQEVLSLNKAQDETNRRLTSIERKQTGILSSLDETVTRKEFQILVNKVAVLEKRH